jgi:predicted dehydrogenase
MKQGKAVLCEKPMAMNQIEVRQMIKTAKENNVFLMEALWTRFNPAFEQVNRWVKENKIGPLRYINSTFSFNALDKGVDSRIFNTKKGGGSRLDICI